MSLLSRSFKSHANRRLQIVRRSLGFILLLFAADTATGGDYRWFEIAMRRELQKCGGPTALQESAQVALADPSQLKRSDRDLGLPPSSPLATFAKGREASYMSSEAGGPFIMIQTGGWDSYWGVMIGRTDLVDPNPMGGVVRRTAWVKEIQPGVFIFAQ